MESIYQQQNTDQNYQANSSQDIDFIKSYIALQRNLLSLVFRKMVAYPYDLPLWYIFTISFVPSIKLVTIPMALDILEL